MSVNDPSRCHNRPPAPSVVAPPGTEFPSPSAHSGGRRRRSTEEHYEMTTPFSQREPPARSIAKGAGRQAGEADNSEDEPARDGGQEAPSSRPTQLSNTQDGWPRTPRSGDKQVGNARDTVNGGGGGGEEIGEWPLAPPIGRRV
ncbi:hypothetical protein CCHR01_04439 [Colletotrichum chrysophilum]|uniref:Uncharacterized protein n=1 Tax=Colletotrichum chrysophilum TaxID=1836956 RepID=A0AAD9ARU4_9PEZI|nr:hypothetical protein CCHR01_04439 [Colletotrichum chrysophilum]